MTVDEAEAILERTFVPIPNVVHLVEANKAETYIEGWRLDVVMGIVAHITAFQMLLRMARRFGHLGSVAWISRSLLEISVWAEYCTSSEAKARRFYEDSLRDTKEMIKAIEPLFPFAQARIPEVSLEEQVKKVQSVLDRAVEREGVQDADAPYGRVSEAAKDLDWEVTFKAVYKTLSKFAHPTALVLVKGIPGDARFNDMLDALFVLGASHATTAYAKVVTHVAALGFPRDILEQA